MQNLKETAREFVHWIKVKIRIHLSDRRVLFNEGEIWWVSLGHNVGVEANGKNSQLERPVLVLKKFSSDSFWGIAISSVRKNDRYHYSFTLEGVYYCCNLSQLRVLSSRRLLRRMTKLPHLDFTEVRKLIVRFIS